MKWKERLFGTRLSGLKNMNDDKELEDFVSWCNQRITEHVKNGDDEAAFAVERGRDAVVNLHWEGKRR